MPSRPETSFLWFSNPLQTFRFIIWKQYWKEIIIAIFLLLFLLALVIFFIQLPGLIVNKIFIG